MNMMPWPITNKQFTSFVTEPAPNSLPWCHPCSWSCSYNITQTHLFCFDCLDDLFSLSMEDGWTTTCMVVTPPGISQRGLRHSPTVLLFSSILPALINLRSFTVLGPCSLSLGHWARTLSFKVETLVAAGKVLGPISDPSVNRNLISSWSCTTAIFEESPISNLNYPQA